MRVAAGLVTAVFASASFATAAAAADAIVVVPPIAPAIVVAPPPPEEPHQGFHLGIVGGYAWWTKDWHWPQFQTNLHQEPAGLLIGVEAGFRIQNGPFVVGVEADWAWTNASATSICPAIVFDCTAQIHWVATATAQVGGALGNILLYAEGGLALAGDEFIAVGPTNWNYSLLNIGWVVGGGVVFQTNSGFFVKAEYNYLNFGTDAFTWTNGLGAFEDVEITQSAHVFKIGIGFRF